jgi:hypothetical protein
MAPSKTTRKGNRRPRRSRSKTPKRLTWKVLGLLGALAALVFGGVLLMHAWAPPERGPAVAERPKPPARQPAPSARARAPEKQPPARPAPSRPVERPSAAERPVAAQAPVYEIFPEKTPPPPPAETDTLHAARRRRRRIFPLSRGARGSPSSSTTSATIARWPKN